MEFSNTVAKQNYERLGFKSNGVGMELVIGSTKITAVEHPLNGVALIFSSVGARTACFFESSAPTYTSLEQIAALIYSNLALSRSSDAKVCIGLFASLGIFQ